MDQVESFPSGLRESIAPESLESVLLSCCGRTAVGSNSNEGDTKQERCKTAVTPLSEVCALWRLVEGKVAKLPTFRHVRAIPAKVPGSTALRQGAHSALRYSSKQLQVQSVGLAVSTTCELCIVMHLLLTCVGLFKSSTGRKPNSSFAWLYPAVS